MVRVGHQYLSECWGDIYPGRHLRLHLLSTPPWEEHSTGHCISKAKNLVSVFTTKWLLTSMNIWVFLASIPILEFQEFSMRPKLGLLEMELCRGQCGWSVDLHWRLGQEDHLEESREAEALRRTRRPRTRRGPRAGKCGGPLKLHVAVAQIKA